MYFEYKKSINLVIFGQMCSNFEIISPKSFFYLQYLHCFQVSYGLCEIVPQVAQVAEIQNSVLQVEKELFGPEIRTHLPEDYQIYALFVLKIHQNIWTFPVNDSLTIILYAYLMARARLFYCVCVIEICKSAD